MGKAVVLGLVLVLLCSSAVSAGANWLSKAAVHVLPHAERTCDTDFPVVIDCGDFITTEPGNSVDAFPVFFDMVECRRIDYAFEWSGGASAVFTSCSDHCQGAVASSGDGVIHTWDSCLATSSVIPGWIWIEGPMTMILLAPNPETGGVWVYDCMDGMDNPCFHYMAGMGGLIGDDPCEPVDPSMTAQDSWGAVKAMFR
jgi:hypothetical protein